MQLPQIASILRLACKDMKADKYDYDVNQRMDFLVKDGIDVVN